MIETLRAHDGVQPAPLLTRSKKILYLLLEVPETNMVLQEFAIPLAAKHDIAIGTLFKAASHVPPTITLFEGDGTVRGFWRVLLRALRADSYDVIHAHTPHVAIVLLAMALLRPRLLRSTVFTVHNCYQNHKRRSRLMMLPIFALFQRIICCSRSSFESFPRVYRSLAGRRMRFIQNGVHTQRIQSVRERLNGQATTARFTVASVSRLVPIKNLPAALQAFTHIAHRDCGLVFIGDGPAREALIEQSRSLGITGNVEFVGLLARDEVYRRLMQCDLFVSTSYGEGLPVAVLEAMACGCPVILSDIAPHREIADHVDFIPLVHPDDVEGFAREIERFRSMPAHERQDIGARCAQLVHERFCLEEMHRRYESIYDDVVNRR